MPIPGKRWWHATLGTYGSWLPGDPRGFRSRKHRIHSSGDHRNPPPPGDHIKLHEYAKTHGTQPIVIPQHLRHELGSALVQRFEKQNHRLLVIAISAMHVHALAELPQEYQQARKQIGTVKRCASLHMRKSMPGQIWADGCGLKSIKDQDHQRNTYRYILKHRHEGAWVWSYKDRI